MKSRDYWISYCDLWSSVRSIDHHISYSNLWLPHLAQWYCCMTYYYLLLFHSITWHCYGSNMKYSDHHNSHWDLWSHIWSGGHFISYGDLGSSMRSLYQLWQSLISYEIQWSFTSCCDLWSYMRFNDHCIIYFYLTWDRVAIIVLDPIWDQAGRQ